MTNVGEVIAERTLILERRIRRKKKIFVRLGKPRVFPTGHADYFCPFQIVGLGEDKIRFAAGVDAFQAIQLVQIAIASVLHFHYRKRFGQAFYWLEKGDNLGFAEPELNAGTETYRKLWKSKRK